MRAEIIAVGTELLLGQVVNTNATFLSEQLAGLGMEVYYQTVVGDNQLRLEGILEEADKRSELIILCGGLGPTEDDLTKQAVADHIGERLVLDERGFQKLERHFQFSGRKMTENNLRQALIIEHGQVLQNPTGLAVGCLITKQERTYLLLPGPPSELKPMFLEEAVPLLKKEFPQEDQLYSTVLRFYGIGESQLVTELQELIEQQSNPTIAPYAKANEVTLRLTAKAKEENVARQLLADVEQEILAKVGAYFYGYGETNSLANVVVEELQEIGWTVTAAESLTAGLFQSTLGAIPGVSNVFPGGFVTYSAETKESFLGVSKELIARDGVVSEACAKAMAELALERAQTDLAVAFTGVAGPDELEEQPAGTVWIALAQNEQPTTAVLCRFNRDRNYIRHSAVMQGLDLIRRRVLQAAKK